MYVINLPLCSQSPDHKDFLLGKASSWPCQLLSPSHFLGQFPPWFAASLWLPLWWPHCHLQGIGKEGRGIRKRNSHPDILILRPVFYLLGFLGRIQHFSGMYAHWEFGLLRCPSMLDILWLQMTNISRIQHCLIRIGGWETAGTDAKENVGKMNNHFSWA